MKYLLLAVPAGAWVLFAFVFVATRMYYVMRVDPSTMAEPVTDELLDEMEGRVGIVCRVSHKAAIWSMYALTAGAVVLAAMKAVRWLVS